KRPQPGAALRKRVLTKRALTVFLEAFAQRLGVDCDVTGEAGFMPGDVVLVSRPRRRGQLKQFAIVSDRTDPQGISLLITLDPGDKVAREAHSLSRYEVVSHYRLSRADLVHVAASLAMTNPSDSSRLL
ncbi:MAG TPA: hypothetical protein DCQ06_10480, partial [Myxococcales bacterium]|nr:hypothetical protein [Myxococcales bacterium]